MGCGRDTGCAVRSIRRWRSRRRMMRCSPFRSDRTGSLPDESDADAADTNSRLDHTAAENDGYVTGLEPATNFPNTRSFESKQGRVVELAGGQTASFRVTLLPLTSVQAVDEVSERIRELQAHEAPEIHRQPRPGSSPGA